MQLSEAQLVKVDWSFQSFDDKFTLSFFFYLTLHFFSPYPGMLLRISTLFSSPPGYLVEVAAQVKLMGM